MQIRFGYVAIALDVPSGSPNKTITLKNLEKIPDHQDRLSRLQRIMTQNLETTLRILRYNAANRISLYRLTSNLVPLATHPLTAGWDYIAAAASLWREIGGYARSNNIRLSAHPDHFTLLNSPRDEVLAASIKDLTYHAGIFEAMGYEPAPCLVMHIGGLYKEKAASLQRFEENFRNLPDNIKLRLMLENDDKIYTVSDTLPICEKLGCPLVLDIHHHRCNNNGETLEELWPRIIATWKDTLPKIHLSSPKSEKDVRSHADYINPDDFTAFIKIAQKAGHDFDVMIEAKQKDLAMFRLIENLARQGGKRLSQAAIYV